MTGVQTCALPICLLSDLEKVPGSKLLEGRFTAVQQSIGTPQGRPAAAEFLGQFVEEIKVNGMVGELFVKHSVRGASVAPLARHVNK